MKTLFNIPEFLRYLNIGEVKNDTVFVTSYDDHPDILLQSPPVNIDFYYLSIKKDKSIVQTNENISDAFLYMDSPNNSLAWELDTSLSGFGILISAKLLNKHAKHYSFSHYDDNHEALFLTYEEKELLWGLFEKAVVEYKKENFSKEVLVSYAALILSYAQIFYTRQFESRSKSYNKVVANFYEHLDEYYKESKGVHSLPSVSYFADKANLTANYFGDLIKHFTGNNPNYHIHQYVIQIAKARIRESNLTVSEIAYNLGFEYPTYFTRFFKKEVGITPTEFRNQ